LFTYLHYITLWFSDH